MQLELGSELRGPAPYETPHLTPPESAWHRVVRLAYRRRSPSATVEL